MNTRPIRVLLIEDNREHAELLTRLLALSEFPKFRVVAATTLALGLAKLGGGEDIILLDLSLPDAQGVETFRRANEAAPNVPIVILSGVSDVTLSIETVQAGAQDYLVKGHVDTHLLLRSIQYAIERKRAQVAAQQVNTELEARVKLRTAELEEANARLQSEIGERRHAEEQLAKSNRQLTVALGELRAVQRRGGAERSATAVREIEEALKRIQQISEVVLRAPAVISNPEKMAEHLRQIVSAADAGRKALRKSRDAAEEAVGSAADEVAAVSTEPVALDALAERAIAACDAKKAGSKISFERKTDKRVEIQGDAARLGEMLAQLIGNSMNAIPRKGKVTVGAHQRGNEAVLSVQDDGLGITEALRLRLLDPGAMIENAEGRMSGYAVIHEVVASHHGRLEIESRKGIGTTVRVIFPSAKASAEAARQRRVLVADDDPMVREVIATYLIEDGYAVELAENGRDALEKFAAGKFDIVLTDRSMPEMGGDELARELKKRNPKIPVILLTGFGDIMAAAGEKPKGVDVVMNKPFTMAGLQNMLAKYR
jgi:DNA-binding response OmpR family regulator